MLNIKPRQSTKPSAKPESTELSHSLNVIRIELSALQLPAYKELSLPRAMVPTADGRTR